MCLPDLSLRGHDQTHHCSPDLAGSRGAQCLSSCFFLALTLCLPLQSQKEMLSFFPSLPLLCMTQLGALLLALSGEAQDAKVGKGSSPFPPCLVSGLSEELNPIYPFWFYLSGCGPQWFIPLWLLSCPLAASLLLFVHTALAHELSFFLSLFCLLTPGACSGLSHLTQEILETSSVGGERHLQSAYISLPKLEKLTLPIIYLNTVMKIFIVVFFHFWISKQFG